MEKNKYRMKYQHKVIENVGCPPRIKCRYHQMNIASHINGRDTFKGCWNSKGARRASGIRKY